MWVSEQLVDRTEQHALGTLARSYPRLPAFVLTGV